jgi:hypothetical protein
MLNRGWLPERGTPADLSSLSHIDLEGVEPHMSGHILLTDLFPIHPFI